MKTESCVPVKAIDNFIVVLDWQLGIANQNWTAAMLIGYFGRWHDYKIDGAKKKVSKSDNKEDDWKDLLQYHTYKKLREALLGFPSRNAIIKAVSLLVKLGIISIHRRPSGRGYGYDRTNYYLFNPSAVKDLYEAQKSIRQGIAESYSGPLSVPDGTMDNVDVPDPESYSGPLSVPDRTIHSPEQDELYHNSLTQSSLPINKKRIYRSEVDSEVDDSPSDRHADRHLFSEVEQEKKETTSELNTSDQPHDDTPAELETGDPSNGDLSQKMNPEDYVYEDKRDIEILDEPPEGIISSDRPQDRLAWFKNPPETYKFFSFPEHQGKETMNSGTSKSNPSDQSKGLGSKYPTPKEEEHQEHPEQLDSLPETQATQRSEDPTPQDPPSPLAVRPERVPTPRLPGTGKSSPLASAGKSAPPPQTSPSLETLAASLGLKDMPTIPDLLISGTDAYKNGNASLDASLRLDYVRELNEWETTDGRILDTHINSLPICKRAEMAIEWLNGYRGSMGLSGAFRLKRGTEPTANVNQVSDFFKRGFTWAEWKGVIVGAASTWDSSMKKKYLRPETLCRKSKCENYLTIAESDGWLADGVFLTIELPKKLRK